MARQFLNKVLILLLMTALTSSIHASEFSLTATLTSEYIFRGTKRSDGAPAFQLGLDYAHDSGLFVGVWGSTVDIEGPNSSRDLELDFYAGYHHEFQQPWSATVTLLRYTFPGQTGLHPYDYNEVLVSATWKERFSLELGYTNDLSNLNVDGHHWEFQVEHPVADTWVLSAGLGRNDMSGVGVSPYYYWDIGASVRWSRTAFDLRWFDNEQPNGFAARNSAGSRLVLSLGILF